MDDAARTTHESRGARPPGRGPLRARSRAVWSVVAVGGFTLATASPTWVSTTVTVPRVPLRS
ncbi:hypothetical protein, partial [Isoptericola sp. QY 916]|uniref:hypothetical protein n=1 Tax=Isoptericola sp. QY 916 TaxID=2782570 RepID=UPI003D2FC1D9|nr:hypothetical protein [Isoptericola sp. QY 916]